MNSWRKIGVGLLPIALMSALVVVGSTPAQAGEGDEFPCVAAAAYDETVVDHVAYDETVVDSEAYDEKVIDTPGQDAVPATDAVYEIEYQFEHAPNGKYKIRWETDPNWNANDNPKSTGWRSTGVIRNGELITAAVPGKDAVEEVSHTVHHDALTHVVTHDAVTHVVHHDAVVCGDEFPPKPDTVVAAVITEGVPNCDTRTVEVTTTTTTTGWEIDEETNSWVPESNPQVEKIVTTRDATSAECDAVIAVPDALPIKDECGTGNAAWVYSGDTSNDFSWDLTDAGALSAIAHKDFVFGNGQRVIEFGMAPESNTEACPVIGDGDPVIDGGDPVIDGGIKPAVDSLTPDRVDPVSAATLPDTGGLSLGWLPLSGLLVVAGMVVLARRRTA